MKPWERHRVNPTTPVEEAAEQAVARGSQSPRARTLAGTIQAAATTTPGALGTTMGQNAGFATLNNFTTGDAETTALSWLVTFWFQGAKQSPKINQDHAKWFVIPLMAIFVGFFTWWAIMPEHDPLAALGRALSNAGTMAANAIANYHSTKPLGWFSSAEEMTTV